MAIQLSTAGVRMYYAVETTAGTRPTSGWTEINEIKSIPEMNPEPSALQTTPLAETEYHTYIPGLKDLGGALGFTMNLTRQSKDDWEAFVDAYDTGASTGMNTWVVIVIPGLEESVFFTGQPSPLGVPAMEVDAVLEATVYITATNAPVWDTKPTIV